MIKLSFSVIALIVVCLFMSSQPAWALRDSRSIQIDHRIHIIMYQPDEVFRFVGHYRYQSMIEFAPGEEIRTISMGDSTAWMLNPSGNRLFLKPIEQDATTNMTIITNMRTYLFQLQARETDDIEDEKMVFIMRFIYPDNDSFQSVSHYLDSVPSPDLENSSGLYNFNYTIAGSDVIAPIRIFDDGEFTFFEFRDKNADVPAFYTVDSHGNEAIVNYRTRGDYIVVERVSGKFTLRHGLEITCVFNEAWQARYSTAK